MGLSDWFEKVWGGDGTQGASNSSGGSNKSGSNVTTEDIILWDMKKYESKNSWPNGDRRLPKLTYGEYGVCSLAKGTEVNIGKLMHRYKGNTGKVDEVHEASAKVNDNVKNGFIFTIYEGKRQVKESGEPSKSSDDKRSSAGSNKLNLYITTTEITLWDMKKYESKHSWPNGDRRLPKLTPGEYGAYSLPKGTLVNIGKLMHRYEVSGKVDEVYEASARVDGKWPYGFIFTIYEGKRQAEKLNENAADKEKKGDNYILNKPSGTNDFQFAKKNGVEIPFSAELKEGKDWNFTSSFGGRFDPFDSTKWEGHSGQDIGAEKGKPIHALHDGTVTLKDGGGYGNLVIINEGNGKETLYAHLSGFNVKDRQEVKRGDLIGYVGNTGRSTGFHLHWEKRINGKPIDPMK